MVVNRPGDLPNGKRVKDLGELLPPIEGTYLILAGPGTGKTRLLVERALQIFDLMTSSKTKILALTFTNKAAGEMRSRLSDAVAAINERSFIGTFHSFAAHALRSHGSAIGVPGDFVIYNEDDQQELLRQLQIDGSIPDEVDVRNLIYAFSRLKSRGVLGVGSRPSDQRQILESVKRIHEIYQRALREANALDFGDLVHETIRLFREKPHFLSLYQTAYSYVLVDEFQDTTPAQYMLLCLLASSQAPNLFVVADEDQLIFEWNEARLETLNHLCEDFGAMVIYSTLSHRCPPTIVEAANAVISKNRFRFLGKPAIQSKLKKGEKGSIWLYEASNEESEANFIVRQVRRLQQEGYSPRDFAVLARARRLLDQAETALQSADIRAARPTLAGLGETETSQAVLRLLRWLQNSRDEQSARRIAQFLGEGSADSFEQAVAMAREKAQHFEIVLADLVDNSKTSPLAEILKRIPTWRLLMRDTKNLLVELRSELVRVLEASGKADDLSAEIADTIQKLIELCKNMSPRERISLPDFLLRLPQIVSGVAISDLPIKEGIVSLLTCHQAKGLEFPIVFLIAMEEGVFPDFRSENDLRRLEEERRLFYVGITRTKQSLYLTYSRTRSDTRGRIWPRRPSRFLNEIPEGLIKKTKEADMD